MLKDKNLRLWVLHTADFYVLERPKTKIFRLEKQKSAVCGRLNARLKLHEGFDFFSLEKQNEYEPRLSGLGVIML